MKGFLKKGGYTSLAPKDSTSNGTISRKEEEEEEEEEKIEYEAVYPSKFTRSCALFSFFLLWSNFQHIYQEVFWW